MKNWKISKIGGSIIVKLFYLQKIEFSNLFYCFYITNTKTTMTTCQGKKNRGAMCGEPTGGGKYCDGHSYFENYTIDMFNNLTKCIRCANMHYKTNLAQCPTCTSRSKIINAKASLKKIHCRGIDRNKNQCREKVLKEGDFCSKHAYMTEYTDDMMNNLSQCSGCRKYYYFNDNRKRCEKCVSRGGENNKVLKDLRSLKHECEASGCKNKAPDSKYCGKHRILQLREDAGEDGFKLCGNGNHKCVNRIPLESKHTYCDVCIQKHSDADKERYQKEKQSVEEFNSEHDDVLKCIKCCKEFGISDCVKDIHGNISKKCKDCFKKQQDIEKHRPKRIRDESEEIKRNPQRKITKDNWKKKNHDKCKSYWQKSRQRKRERLGEIEYKLQLVEQSRKYRNLNPEKMKEQYEKTRKNPHHRYVFYKRRAEGGGIKTKNPFNLTEIECKEYFTSRCHYCGYRYDGEVLNGIDRVNNNEGYSKDNCVSCCTMCNMMKRVLSREDFLHMCEHILGYMRIIEDCKMFPNAFKNYKSTSYDDTKRCSIRRKIIFELNEKQFDIIKSMPCYLCGKICSDEHNNGIDRINSKYKYCVENCKSCCGNCNYLKKNYVLYEFLTQLIKIVCYSNVKNTPEEIQDAIEYNMRRDVDAVKIINESDYIIEQLSTPCDELMCEK